jgi:hypothetical protein
VDLYFACVKVRVQVAIFFGATNFPRLILHNPVAFQVGEPFPTVLISETRNVLEPFFNDLTEAMVAVTVLAPTFAPASNCEYTWLAL